MKISTILNTSKKPGFRQFLFGVIDFFTESHLWISLAAFALYGHTLNAFQGSFGFDALGGLIFFGTWSAYGFLKLRKNPPNAQRPKNDAHFRIIWYASVIIGLSAAVYFMGFLSLRLRWLVIVGMIMTGLYSLPLGGTVFRIRSLPLLKIFLISFTWTWVTLILPWSQTNEHLPIAFPWMAVCSRFIFIFAITLPFDYRDRYTDQAEGTLTFPILLGWTKTKLIAYFLLWTGIALELVLEFSKWMPGHTGFVNILTYLIALIMVFRVNPTRNNRYFVFGIDGLMIIPFILSWLVHKIL